MNRNKKMPVYIWLLLAIPVFYCGLLVGQYYEPSMNLKQIMEIISIAFAEPFAISMSNFGIKFGLGLLAMYAMAVLYYYSSNNNTRKGEEHGSAKWANIPHVSAIYKDKGKQKDKKRTPPSNKNVPFQDSNDMILSKNVRFSMNSHQHRRNLNMLVVGGSGAGKTRFFVKPNLMQCNCSYVITDPKTEILYATGNMFKEAGYKVKVLNLIDMDASDCYNPFCYIQSETDVIKLIKNLIKSTTEKGASKGDPFWEASESALLQALIFFLLERMARS